MKSVRSWQREVSTWAAVARPKHGTPLRKLARMVVEVGELAEAVLRYELDPTDAHRQDVADEGADVLALLLNLLDLCGVDTLNALTSKWARTLDRKGDPR